MRSVSSETQSEDKFGLARAHARWIRFFRLFLLVVAQAHLYVSDKNLYTLTGNINSSMNICISAMGVWAPCSCSGQIVTSV